GPRHWRRGSRWRLSESRRRLLSGRRSSHRPRRAPAWPTPRGRGGRSRPFAGPNPPGLRPGPGSGRPGPSGLRQPQIAAMNNLNATTVAENCCNFTALVAGDEPDVGGGIGREAARGLIAGAGADHDAIAALEGALDADHASGKEALAAAE